MEGAYKAFVGGSRKNGMRYTVANARYKLGNREGPQKRYWGKHFSAIGYGVWSAGNLTKQLIEAYLEHHR
jgi:REP element-mobilizing transposase RayT